MPFCPNCGAAVEGRYCAKCGTLVEASTPGATEPAPASQAPVVSTAAGLEDNVAGALCYLVGFITGIIFLVLEPYNKRPFVRFHAFQSILFCVAWFVIVLALNILFGMMYSAMHLWFIFVPLRALIGVLGFGIWLFCMFKAYNREQFELPIIGPMAARQAARP